MTPAERRNDIAALRQLGREWDWLIAHHQNELRKDEAKK